MPHDRMLATRNTYTWINKYIFPGGFLPSVEAIERDHPRRTPTLRVTDRLSFGQHYAETLRQWDERVPGRARARCWRSASTRRSCGCGTSTWSTPGPASPRGYLDVQQIVLRRGRTPMTADRTAARRRTDARRASPHRLEAALRPFVGGELPVRLRAWDGSRGRARRTRRWSCCARRDALRRLLWHPGELGAAQAYVTGELDVEGDLDAALTHVWRGRRERGLSRGPAVARRRSASLLRAARSSARSGRRRPPPASRRGSAAGCTAAGPRPAARSATTTTSPTSSTR